MWLAHDEGVHATSDGDGNGVYIKVEPRHNEPYFI